MQRRVYSRTYTRHVYGMELEGQEVELGFKPNEYNDPLTHVVGDKLIVAYLSHDDDPSNPMTNHSCQGTLYTRRSATDGVITDNDSELRRALCLNSYGEPDEDARFNLDGRTVTLLELAVDQVYSDIVSGALNLEPFCRDYPEAGDIDDATAWLAQPNQFNGAAGTNGDFLRGELMDYRRSSYWEHVEHHINGIYARHWRSIVGPYVVPVSYFSERGSTSISPTTWDGDPGDLPDGVWVADKDAQENIDASVMAEGYEVGQVKGDDGKYTPVYALTYMGGEITRGTLGACWGEARKRHPTTPGDTLTYSTEYAEGVLEEYSSWCEGDCWGCVVETHERQADGTWERIDSDECWGFIGIDYAGQSLHEDYFNPAVERLTAAATV